MNRHLKALTSVVLSLIMIFSVCPLAFAAENTVKDSRRVTVPTVYVKGFGQAIYKDKNDPNSECIYSDKQEVRPETYEKLFAGFKEPLLEAIKTHEWQGYSDFIVNTLIGDMSRFKLDDNGEASDGSGNDFRHDKNPVNRKGGDGKYDLYSYFFVYDQRLDPFENAARLNEYIEKVKKATGFEKVNLFGRCYGTTIVMAYLSAYGYESLNALELYIGFYEGLDVAGALYSGQAYTDPYSLQIFCEKNLPDNEDMTLLKALIGVMNATMTLNLPIDLVYEVYNEIYQDVIPRLLLESFATFPGYWTLIGPEYYDDAMAFLYKGQEERFAKIIEKADRYHNEVMLKADELIENAVKSGVNVYNFAKYGGTQPPLCKESLLQSDGTTSIEKQCFGTKSAEMFRPFSYSYIKEAEKQGMAKYISADNLIDASGDLLKDHTWFAKGVGHGNMPAAYDVLMANIFERNGYGEKTFYVPVDYFDAYPQFLIAESDNYNTKLVPLTAENKADGDDWHKSPLENFTTVLRKMFGWITELIRAVKLIVAEIKK